ncbi:hypothetical protein JAB4_059610 (plasmid) [Janthinobacterium sp. HH102]|uniref:hypothetical protein n=1 Tax=Janthinobacterium sp. HH102 TaxID=1537274 RepID=UPI00089327A5|nr:hypothetical protein [Janthinobacterium sp. HH102]QOU76461.1 hypothetical protein JAB4_059610 [Janthinobacterium sp. HH102]
MTVHRIPAVPGKFKKGKERGRPEPSTVEERIQQMKDRRTAAQKIGVNRQK